MMKMQVRIYENSNILMSLRLILIKANTSVYVRKFKPIIEYNDDRYIRGVSGWKKRLGPHPTPKETFQAVMQGAYTTVYRSH